MKKIIFLIIFAFFLSTYSACRADDIRVAFMEGTLDRVRIGNDSFEIILKDSKGELVSFLITEGAYEWMTDGDKTQLEKIKNSFPGKKWPGRTWPVITDKYSKIRVWYIEKPCTFLSYEVLQKTVSLWITIVASTKDKQVALDVKNQVLLQKFDTGEIINSDDYKTLRSGYIVVVVGAFLTRKEALKELEKAKAKGWKDGYVKKLW